MGGQGDECPQMRTNLPGWRNPFPDREDPSPAAIRKAKPDPPRRQGQGGRGRTGCTHARRHRTCPEVRFHQL